MPCSTLVSLYITVVEARLDNKQKIEAAEMLLKATHTIGEGSEAKPKEKEKLMKVW